MDNLQRVSGIVRSDHSEFAQAMAPPSAPPAPEVRRGIGCLIVGAVWFIPALVLWIAVHPALPIVALICFGVPGAYGVYHFWGKHQLRLQQRFRFEDHESLLRQHGETLQVWEQFEYCFRCHGVFLPGNDWQFDVNQNHELIHHNNAWWYAARLAAHRAQQDAPILVGDQGPLTEAR